MIDSSYRAIWDYAYAEGVIAFDEPDYCECATCVYIVTGK